MDDDGKIDLSSLDPSVDEVRWQRLIARTTERALAAGRRPASVLEQLTMWWRPVLATAAALAVLAGAGGWMGARDVTPTQPSVSDPAYALADWAASEQLPSTLQILRTLGVEHESR